MITTEEMIAELKDTIATLEAFWLGEETQWFNLSLGAWKDDSDPRISFGMGRRIRIKPKPREWWDNIFAGNRVDRHLSKEHAEANAYNRIECIHVREVID